MKKGKRLAALLLSVIMLLGCTGIIIPAGAAAGVTLTGAYVVKDACVNAPEDAGKILKFKFDTGIMTQDQGNIIVDIRIQNENGVLVYDKTGDEGPGDLRWTGSFGYADGYGWHFKLLSSVNVYGETVSTFPAIFALTEKGGRYEGLNYSVKVLIFTQNDPALDQAVPLIVSAADASSYLIGNSTVEWGAAQRDCCTMPVIKAEDSLELQKVTMLDDRRLILDFSEDVTQDGRYFSALRILNENNVLVYKDGDTYNTTTAGSPMQYAIWYNLAEGKLVGTLADGRTLSGINAILASVKEQIPGAKLMFCLEEKNLNSAKDEHGNNWYVDTVTGKTSKKMLSATYKNGLDGVYMPLTFPAANDYVLIDSAKTYGTNQFVIKFSEKVGTLGSGSYNAIRIYKDDDLLYYDNGSFNTSATGSPVQWSLVDFNTYKGMAASEYYTATFEPNLDCSNWTQVRTFFEKAKTADPANADKYQLVYCCEDSNAAGSRMCDSISSAGTPGKALVANLLRYGVERHLEPLQDGGESWLDPSSVITIEKAEIISSKDLLVTFSEPAYGNVFSDRPGWVSMRIVDEKEAFLSFPNATVLQWGGDFAPVAAGEQGYIEGQPNKVWKFHLTAGTNSIDNLDMLMEACGENSFYEKLGGKLTFSIEQIIPSGRPDTPGVVDNITSADGLKVLAATNTKGYGNGAYIAPVYAASYDAHPVNPHVKSVRILNDKQALLTFSEPVKFNTEKGGQYVGVRITEASTGWLANRDGYLQWSGNYTVYDEASTQIIFTLTDNVKGCDTFPKIIKWFNENKEALELDRLCFAIEEANGGRNDAIVCNIISKESGRPLIAQQMYATAYNDGIYLDFSSVEDANKITVKKAEIVGKNLIRVTFSEPVTRDLYNTVKKGYTGVRIVDAQQNLQTLKPSGDYYQFYKGTFAPADGGDGSVWYYTLDSAGQNFALNDLDDIMNISGAGSYYGNKGYYAAFCMEQELLAYNGAEEGKDPAPSSASKSRIDINGVVDNFTSLDGTRVLVSTNGGWDNYTALTYAAEYESGKKTALNLTDVSVPDDMHILATFSEEIEIASDGYVWGIRITDPETGWLAWDGEDPLQWVWKNEPQHYNGRKNTLYYTFVNAGYKGCFNVHDVLDYFNANYKEAGYKLCFAIEEAGGVRGDGYVSNIVSAETGTPLLANFLHSSYSDGVYIPFSEANFGYNPTRVTISGIEQINENDLVVTFSEPVWWVGTEMAHKPFIGMRLVDDNNNLIWVKNQKLSTEAEGGSPMQWSAGLENATFLDDTHLKMKVHFAGINLTDLLSKKVINEALKEFHIRFAIEEANPEDGSEFYPADGRIHNLRTEDGRLLSANGAKRARWDGDYQDSSVIVKPATTRSIGVISTKVLSNTQIELTFSEPVTIGKVFAGLRLVDEHYNLAYEMIDDEQQWYQWSGHIEQTDPDDLTKAVFTHVHGGNAAFPCYAIGNVLSYETDDLHICLCIEENGAITVGNGFVETVTGLDGLPASASPALLNRADGMYIEFNREEIPDEPPLEVVSVSVPDDMHILATFSEDLEIAEDGYVWGIRITDPETGWLAWDGEDPLQWVWKNEPKHYSGQKNTLYYTFVNAGYKGCFNVHDVLDYFNANYKDAGYKLCFAIEEAGGVRGDGYISNIVAAETGMPLQANFANPSYADGLYIPFSEADFEYDTTRVIISGIEQINESDLIVTFSEPVYWVGTEMEHKPFIGMRLVDDDNNLIWVKNQKLSTEAEGGTPMQWGAGIKNVSFTDDTHLKMLVHFPGVNLTDLLNKKVINEALKEFHIRFAIEEANPEDGVEFYAADGRIHNLRTEDGRLLSANGAKRARWDGDYQDSSVIVKAPTTRSIGVKSTKVLNDTQIELTFTEPVHVEKVYAGLRLVDAGYNMGYEMIDGKQQWYQWTGRVEQPDPEDLTKAVFTLSRGGNSAFPCYGISEVLSYETDERHICLCIEENGAITVGTGFVETVKGLDGLPASAAPALLNWADGMYIEFNRNELPKETLNIKSVKAIADNKLILTFTGAVEFIDKPWLSLRLVDKDMMLLYSSEERGKEPMQWGVSYAYYDEAHTQLLLTMHQGKNQPYSLHNLTDILNYDWSEDFGKDAHIMFCAEELNECKINNNGMVENFKLVSDPRVRLKANRMPGGSYDGVYWDIDVDYKMEHIAVSARILDDVSILITFSEPVEIQGKPFIALRYLDKNGVLVWNGEANKSTPLQFSGSWDWANDSHTALKWVMNGGNTYGAKNLTDVFNYGGALCKWEGCRIVLGIEETSNADFTTKEWSGVVDNIISKDKTRHLGSNYSFTLDGVYMSVNAANVKGDKVTLKRVTAIDDMHLEIEFSEPVTIKEDDFAPMMRIRYLTPTGDTEVLTDGKLATFRGKYTWKDDSHTVLTWELDTATAHGANNLSDIYNFEGGLNWNKGAEVAFVITDPDEDHRMPKYSMLVAGILAEGGYKHLAATRLNDLGVCQCAIEWNYELPAPTTPAEEETPEENIVYVTDYLPTYIGSGVIVLVGLVVGVVLFIKRRKENG